VPPFIADASQNLAAILPKLPKCMGLLALMCRCTRPRGSNAAPSGGAGIPASLDLDISSRTIVKGVPALLPAHSLAKVASVRLLTPSSYAEMPMDTAPPAHGWAALVAAVPRHMPQLTSFTLAECTPDKDAAPVMAELTHLTALTHLSLACLKIAPRALTAALAPTLSQLTTLRSLHLFGGGRGARQGVAARPFVCTQQPSQPRSALSPR
jgi:hypothetical protein